MTDFHNMSLEKSRNAGKSHNNGCRNKRALALPTDVLNRRYFPTTSIASRTPASSNGHCPSSPCGAHYWKIVPPGGPMSLGVCWYCGEEREFYNRVELEFKR